VNLVVLLDMATAGYGDRVALGSLRDGVTFTDLGRRARGGAAVIAERGAHNLLYLGRNGPGVAQALFAAAAAGVHFTPLNYRLPAERIDSLLDHFDAPLVIVDPDYADVLAPGRDRCDTAEFFASADTREPADAAEEGDDADAVMLFTSGTSAEPKLVALTHGNLASYVLGTVDFGSADDTDCALTTTPPYHIAAIASILTNLYAGRRVVYLPDFDAAQWLRTVRDEAVTSAMVVPTMLSRIVDELDGQPADAPSLRLLSYGGSRAAPTVVEAAMALFTDTGFCNAYGLTETSSTVALLGPDEHRSALASDNPAVRRRLSSVGHPVPGVEIEIRDESGRPLPPGGVGELWLRGPQISARYGHDASLDADGWLATRDQAFVDDEGYLFIEGRLDDTIIRGGENIAPSEIEDVLRRHPDVADVAVFGVPDEQWGQQIVAAVVRRAAVDTAATTAADTAVDTAMEADVEADALRAWARGHLRGSRTPDRIRWVSELPYSPTGKLLRREVVADAATPAP
jgi:acyl-CoA synthetase (AMP-forming)/AMP-acid ligase II